MILPGKFSLQRLFSADSWLVSVTVVFVASLLLSIVITQPYSKLPFLYLFVFPSIIILIKPEVGIWFILSFVFYVSYLADEIFLIPGTSIWMVEVSIVVLLLRTIHGFIFKKKKFQITPVDYLLVFLILEGFVSGVLNHNSLISTMLGCRKLLKMVILYYFIIHINFEEEFFKKIIKFLYITALIQGPVALIQFMVWTPELEAKMVGMGHGGWSRVDFSGGTIGISGITAIYAMGFICFTLAFMLNDKLRLGYVFKFLLLIMPMLIGSSMASFLYLPVLMIFMLRKRIFSNVKNGIFICIGLCVCYVVLIKSASLVGYDLASFIMSPGAQFADQAHFSGEGQPVGRIANIMFAYTLLNETIGKLIMGFGPNSVSLSAFGSGYAGKLLMHLLENEMVKSAASFINSQVAFMLLEWGFFGLGLYIIIIIKIFLMNMKFYKAIDDSYWKTVSFGYSGITVLYTITIFYKAVWVTEASACMFWIFAGIIFAVGKKRGIFCKAKQV